MRWLIFILFLALYGFSCPDQIDFDGSERERIKGVVEDNTGNPVENISVSILGYITDGSMSYETIQRGITNNKGQFELIFSRNNAGHYMLSLNPDDDQWYASNSVQDERFAEKLVFFSTERIRGFEFEIPAPCALNPGIPLNFVCENKDPKIYYYVYLETEFNIYLDPLPIYRDYHPKVVNNNSITKVIVPENSKVKMNIYSGGTSYIDSIYVSDTPYTYTLKQ